MIEPRRFAEETDAPRSGVDEVVCPSCGADVEITAALSRSIRARYEAEFKAKEGRRAKRLQAREAALKAQETALEASREDFEAELEKRTAERVEAAAAHARTEAEQAVATEIGALRERLTEASNARDAAKKNELGLLKLKEDLERKQRDIDLTVARRMAEDRERIRAETLAEERERSTIEVAQRDTKIDSLRRTIEELQKKVEQGSQQLQGEALEVSLESVLGEAFPQDVFEPVPKGIRGADLIQRVRTPAGLECGTILWEAKRTKHWVAGWLPKLRDDQRALKAELAVIVSTVLPKDTQPPTCIDNVWVSNHTGAVGLARALRHGLTEVAGAKQALVGRQDKMQMLYGYLCGPEFKNRIEGLLEPFQTMREELEAEKRQIRTQWAKREKQIERASSSTAGLYGDLQGIAGGSLPGLAALDLPALAEGDEA